MAKRTAKTEDYLTFVGKSDTTALPSEPERDLAQELYRKSYQGKTIDQFEKNLGINPPRPKKNLKYKIKIFSPDYEKDVDLLNELMNNPKYQIVTWDKTWTVEGLYKVCVVYSEDTDHKSAEEKLQETAEGA